MAVRQMNEKWTKADSDSYFSGTPIDPSHFTVEYEGAVLETYERNGYDDSDFWAVVWDEAEGKIKEVEFATTRGWTYPNGANVDATIDVIEKARTYAYGVALESAKSAAASKAKTPDVGKRVHVKIARGKNRGEYEGVVFWSGKMRPMGSYWMRRYGGDEHRIGVDANGQRFFTRAENATVLEPENYIEGLDEIEARVRNRVWSFGNGASWRSLDYGLLADRGLVTA